MNTMNKTKRPDTDNTINEHRRDSIQRILDFSRGDIKSFETLVNKKVDETENLEIKYLDIFYNIALGQYTLLGVFTIYNTMFVVSKGGTWITPRAEVINEFIAAIHNWVSRLTYGSGNYEREGHKICWSDVDVAYNGDLAQGPQDMAEPGMAQPVATNRNPHYPHYNLEPLIIQNEVPLTPIYIREPTEVNGEFLYTNQAPRERVGARPEALDAAHYIGQLVPLERIGAYDGEDPAVQGNFLR